MQQQPGNSSEIARLREQIAREHEAACWALTGLAVGTAQHWFITRRMEHIGVHQQRLSELIGEQASMALVVAVMDDSPPQQREQMTKRQSGVSDASGNVALDRRIW
jgi:hypothetical protein